MVDVNYMLSKFSIWAVSVGVAWISLSILARSRWNASVSSFREIGPDGMDRDSRSFSSGYANTLLVKTIGKTMVARAQAQFSRQQRMREATKARLTPGHDDFVGRLGDSELRACIRAGFRTAECFAALSTLNRQLRICRAVFEARRNDDK